ncbi:MAG: glycosyltransferase [Scytonematopsis contorta HA4267-MV1]|nr:glycosyltransferase [Scytonematopsis contorta HA4267-MV1]
MPKISVIIPAYNSENTIAKTITSVLKQTFDDWELIVINDGSSDSTLEIISSFQDERIKVFSYPNAGGNISRNRGLDLAIGEFVSFLDADDLWTPDKLELQLQLLQENPQVAVAYSWTNYIDENDKFILSGRHSTFNGDVYEKLIIANFLENGSNPLIRKTAILELGGFDKDLPASQDWDMYLRLAAKHHFMAVPKAQILYRVSGNSLSTNLVRQEKTCLYVIEKALQLRASSVVNLRKQSLANLYKYLTCKALQKPFNRQKAFTAAKFLWKYFINNYEGSVRLNFMLTLFFKIILILIFGGDFSFAFLRSIRGKAKQLQNG